MQDMSTRQMRKILRTNGFSPVRTHSSHVIYSTGKYTVSVPMADKTICGALAAKLVKEIESNGI